MTNTDTGTFKKRHIKEMAQFALNYIPQLDATTLVQFLELVNADGTCGSISRREFLRKMDLTLKYIPNACPHSLFVLADLLEIKTADPLIPLEPSPRQVMSRKRTTYSRAIIQ